MADYNRDRKSWSQSDDEHYGDYKRSGDYRHPNTRRNPEEPFRGSESKDFNKGYSSYGADNENPYEHSGNRDRIRNYGDAYGGNFSGSNYDRDYEFGYNRRGAGNQYGQYGNLDYSGYRQDWRHNPANLGAGSNYAYNRGGYGSNFGGEYGNYGAGYGDTGSGYASEFGGESYSHRRGNAYDDPYRRYSSYTGRYDSEKSREWKQDNRDWLDKAGDEVASWFGDEDAEYRRRMDKWYGQHRGRGPKNYRRSDSRIEEDVNDRLSDDGWLDASGIEVKVENAEVILTGTVPDRYSKRRAEDVAEAVSGVSNVENRLRVVSDLGNTSTDYRTAL